MFITIVFLQIFHTSKSLTNWSFAQFQILLSEMSYIHSKERLLFLIVFCFHCCLLFRLDRNVSDRNIWLEVVDSVVERCTSENKKKNTLQCFSLHFDPLYSVPGVTLAPFCVRERRLCRLR